MKNLVKETVFEVACLLQIKLVNSDFIERNYRLIKKILKEKIKKRKLLSRIISALWLIRPILLALIHDLLRTINDDISRAEPSVLSISDETYKVITQMNGTPRSY